MPEISIIIPCYNCAPTLRETIQSVLSQDFSDFEIIAVDDGSTDETPQILQQLARDAGGIIRIHSQHNAGVSAARNEGLRLSRGRYILFLDADDLLADGLLQAVSTSMKVAPSDTLCFFYTNNPERFRPIAADSRRTEQASVAELLERLTYSKRDVVFCSFVYDAKILTTHNLRFVEGARYGEDWEFTTKYLAHCRSARILPQYGYYYRIVAGSVTRTVHYSQTDAIDAATRTHAYLLECNHPFAGDFGEYMYPRAVFSVAHRFGQVRSRELYDRLRREHDLKAVMSRMVKNPNVDWKSRLAAAAYLIHPYLYYLISVF